MSTPEDHVSERPLDPENEVVRRHRLNALFGMTRMRRESTGEVMTVREYDVRAAKHDADLGDDWGVEVETDPEDAELDQSRCSVFGANHPLR